MRFSHGSKSWRAGAAVLAGTLAILAAMVASAPGAVAAYDAAHVYVGTSSLASAKEAYELSGLVASPTHPDWYWAESDVWKTDDVFVACSGLSGASRARCQQVQRTRLWAIHLDPTTHQVLEVRPFALANPAWALDPMTGQPNDWEDIDLGPDRGNGHTLVISATGNSVNNPVRDASGKNISCDTRRLIELPEPDFAGSTWTIRKIFDLKNMNAKYGSAACNAESLVVAGNRSGVPTGYYITRGGGKVFSRSLADDTGRAPDVPRAAAGSGLRYAPQSTYEGVVAGASGLQLTSADSNGTNVAILHPQVGTSPAAVLTWPLNGKPLVEAITQVPPTKWKIGGQGAEGLSYASNASAGSPEDLFLLADRKQLPLTYWFLSWF
jgi:hypothetical protein